MRSFACFLLAMAIVLPSAVAAGPGHTENMPTAAAKGPQAASAVQASPPAEPAPAADPAADADPAAAALPAAANLEAVQSQPAPARDGLTVAIPRPEPVDDAYHPEDEQAAIRWLDARGMAYDFDAIYKAIRPLAEKETRPELQWRYARGIVNYYEGHREASDKEKLAAYELTEDLSRSCVNRFPNKYPHCYLQLGISIGRKATVKGVLRSLRSARSVEDTWQHGLRLSDGKPYMIGDERLDAHFYYALGIFYRLVPDWWIVKLLAGTRGDKQKSIDYHRKSVKLRSDPSTWLELGVSLACRGQKEDDGAQFKEGLQWIRKVSEIMPNHDLDRVDKRNAKVILANPKLACGYSRDKFQDVDDQSKVR